MFRPSPRKPGMSTCCSSVSTEVLKQSQLLLGSDRDSEFKNHAALLCARFFVRCASRDGFLLFFQAWRLDVWLTST
jgi:hypothetical protein